MWEKGKKLSQLGPVTLSLCVSSWVALTGGTPAVEVIAYLGPEDSERNYGDNCRLEWAHPSDDNGQQDMLPIKIH